MNFLLWLESLKFCVWVRESDSIWAFPMFLFMHTLGMSMIAGVSAVVDIAILGFWPRIPIKPLERLYPLMWTGFWINAVTGTVLMVADASTKLLNPVFYIKMCFELFCIMTCVTPCIRTSVTLRALSFARWQGS
jgi:hypothetical protein